MSGGLFDLAGMTGAKPGDTAEDLLKKGQIDEEEALLLKGLLGDAPVDPGDDFREYMGSQGGAKGFFGSALNPLITRGLFSDDFNDYRDARANYATDKAIFDARSAGIEQYMKNSAGDAQDNVVAQMLRDGVTGPDLTAAIVEAGGVEKQNLNDVTLAQGGLRIDRNGNPIAYNPKDNSTTAERNLAARQALYAREPQKGTPEHQRWQDEVRFFESSVRANSVVNGVVRSGSTAEVVGNEADFHASAASAAEAETAGAADAQYGADTFQGAAETYRATWEQSQIINERLANVDQAIELFDPDNPNRLDTGPIKGGIYKIFGIGQEGLATIENMSIQETMEWLINFKGPTTDYEFDKSSAAAFANIMKGEEVNAEQLQIVRQTLEKVARLNNAKGEAAYGTLQDYQGEPGKAGDRSQDFESINKNYAPWFEPKGSQEGIIDGVPTFARFSADMEKRAKAQGIEMSAADIRALYNQHYPTPRK
jgi:hypothetical protein